MNIPNMGAGKGAVAPGAPLVSRPKALIYGRREGAPYHPLGPIEPELLATLSPRFDLEATDDPAALRDIDKTGAGLLLGLDDNWTEPPDMVALRAVEAWVRAGGALLLIHNGICWARDPRWRRLAGGRFTGHEAAKPLRFTRGSDASTFDLLEEPYRFSRPIFHRCRTVATYEDGGRAYPALWIRRLGSGRIGYSLPGHSPEAFRVPAYRVWLLDLAIELIGR
jgi:hypothetical protein